MGKGKPQEVALTAVMRKLLVLAHTLVQPDRTWTAHPPREYPCSVLPTTLRPAGSGEGGADPVSEDRPCAFEFPPGSCDPDGFDRGVYDSGDALQEIVRRLGLTLGHH